MYVDFDALKEISKKFHEAYETDGADEAWREGRHVYSIEFKPDVNNVRVHMSWTMFKNLVADIQLEQRVPEITRVNSKSIVCFFKMHDVDCVACLGPNDLKQEFELLGLPDEDHTIDFEDDVLRLFNLWQSVTGWGLLR